MERSCLTHVRLPVAESTTAAVRIKPRCAMDVSRAPIRMPSGKSEAIANRLGALSFVEAVCAARDQDRDSDIDPPFGSAVSTVITVAAPPATVASIGTRTAGVVIVSPQLVNAAMLEKLAETSLSRR